MTTVVFTPSMGVLASCTVQLVWIAAFSPDGTRVVTASEDGTARIWRIDGGAEPLVLKGHSRSVNTAKFSSDGTRVVTASLDGTARIWRVSPEPFQELLREVTTACLTPQQREHYLGEAADDARSGYLQCERSHGRNPSVTSVRDLRFGAS